MASVSGGCKALTRFLVDQTTTCGKPDWDRVLRLAEAHEITPYVYRGVVGGQYADVPPRVLAQLEREHESSTQRNRVLRDEFPGRPEAAAERGHRGHSVQGAPESSRCRIRISGCAGSKTSTLLVDIDDLGGIRDVLKDLGYETEKPEKDYLKSGFEHLDKDYSFLRKSAWSTGRAVPGSFEGMRKSGWVILEPHWSLTHPRLNIDLPARALRDRMCTLEHEGERINALSPEDNLLVACIVGGKSEWRSLKLVADVVAAIESSPDLDWNVCLERSTQVRARRMFLLGCLLANQLAGASIPEEVELSAMRERSLARLARDVRRDVGDESAPTRVDPRRFSLRMIRLREHRRDQWRYAIDTLTAPGSQELRLLRLPQPLRFLYRLVVPLTRYVAIPAGRHLRDFVRRGSEGEGSPTAS